VQARAEDLRQEVQPNNT